MSSLQIIEDRSLTESQALFKTFREQGGHTSFSATNTYLMCPKKYRFRYVERVTPEFVADNLLFGIAVHSTVARFYSYLKSEGETLHIDKLLSDWELAFESAIADAKYPVKYGKKTRSELLELGKTMLTVFATSIRPQRIVGIEVPFRLPLYDPRTGELLGIKLIGSMDLIEADDAGNIIVSDLKTASKKWSDLDAAQSLQASLYSFALSEMLDLPEDAEVQCRFDVLTKAKSPVLQQLSTARGPKDRRRIIGLIADVLRAAEARVFHRNPSWACLRCEFRQACDAEME